MGPLGAPLTGIDSFSERHALRIVLAQPRGFCAGVVRAIAVVETALRLHGPGVHVRHEIVHNRRVVAELERQGAIFVDDLSDVPDGALIIFSAHGVPRAVEVEAARRGLRVIDATCPLVARVHAHGRHYAARGRAVLLIGHGGHAEVVGTAGQIDGEVHLVGDAADVDRLAVARDRPVAYVTQTTLSVDDTRATIAAIHRRFADVIGPETSDICYATQNRQAAVRALAREVELLLVVGAANSSNSTRLREIGAQLGVAAYLISGPEDFRAEWLRGVRVVGLTAGASAPETAVQDMIASLATFGPIEVSTQPGPAEDAVFKLPPGLDQAS